MSTFPHNSKQQYWEGGIEVRKSRGCLERTARQPQMMSFRANFRIDKKTGGNHPASFCILWAIHTKPHSVLTFSNPLKLNLRKCMLCLIWPKTDSTSTLRCTRRACPARKASWFLACSRNGASGSSPAFGDCLWLGCIQV